MNHEEVEPMLLKAVNAKHCGASMSEPSPVEVWLVDGLQSGMQTMAAPSSSS